MNFRPGAHWLGLVLVVIAAVGLRGWEQRVRELAPAAEILPEQMSALGPRGGTLAVLGGFRAVIAGGLWLRTNLAWERREAAETILLIEMTVAADARTEYFWLNGARMIAYDLPTWTASAPLRPVAVRREQDRALAHRALQLLEKGLRWHGPSADLYLEMGNIHLRRLEDYRAAADHYGLAAVQPDAPFYAGRIYAELLVNSGRTGEAVTWLRAWVGTLPEADPAARKAEVEARLRVLESVLVQR